MDKEEGIGTIRCLSPPAMLQASRKWCVLMSRFRFSKLTSEHNAAWVGSSLLRRAPPFASAVVSSMARGAKHEHVVEL